MTVKNVAYGRFSSVGAGGHPWRARARAVKYMANRPAKNISSLESHTIVPTLTTLGRVSECTLLDSKLGAAAVEVTPALWPGRYVLLRSGVGVLPTVDARRNVGRVGFVPS